MAKLSDLLTKIAIYLEEEMEGFQINRKLKRRLFTCPLCKNPTLSCYVRPSQNYTTFCQACNKSAGNLIDIVRFLEPDKKEWIDNDIIHYLSKRFKIEIVTEFDTEEALNLYERYKFDLVPIVSNGKIPVEKDWTNPEIHHTSKKEWKVWLETGLNIGVKTGRISNITVIDIDIKPIPEEIKPIMGSPLIQETNKGYHLFYQYEKDLPKANLRKINLPIDLENDGGQVLLFPSIVEGNTRRFITQDIIGEMPKEFKDFLLKNTDKKEPEEVNQDKDILNLIDKGTIDYFLIPEGSRNTTMISLGGILRKELNLKQTSKILKLINRNFVDPPLNSEEIEGVLTSIEKYVNIDDRFLAEKILEYLKLTPDGAYGREVQEVVKEPKEKVDACLNYLIKEGSVVKSRRVFNAVKKANWTDTFDNIDNTIDFEFPYFNDVGTWEWGDLILLGARSKIGKTTICMNLLKKIIEQGKKPYYLYLETGSRFKKSALKLGLKEGDFFFDWCTDPLSIQIEEKSITILDWLLPENYAETDKLLKKFVEQLHKVKGFLIIFMQLKKDNTWFSPNMVEFFPSLAARYVYDDDTGITGKWVCDVIREPRGYKQPTIPCKYDRETKLFRTISELDIETEKTLEGVI